MKKIKFIFLLFMGLGMAVSVCAQDLEKFKWNNRIVLVEDAEYESEEVIEQIKLLKQAERAMYERKVIVVQSGGDAYRIAHKKSFRKDDDVKPTEFRVVLIGLDGGVKFESNEIVEPQVLIDLIDSMPMRRAEMRQKGN